MSEKRGIIRIISSLFKKNEKSEETTEKQTDESENVVEKKEESDTPIKKQTKSGVAFDIPSTSDSPGLVPRDEGGEKEEVEETDNCCEADEGRAILIARDLLGAEIAYGLTSSQWGNRKGAFEGIREYLEKLRDENRELGGGEEMGCLLLVIRKGDHL